MNWFKNWYNSADDEMITKKHTKKRKPATNKKTFVVAKPPPPADQCDCEKAPLVKAKTKRAAVPQTARRSKRNKKS